MENEEKHAKGAVYYLNGAVISMENKGDHFEIRLYDHAAEYFCRTGLGIKVSNGYRFGIRDTDTKNRYEIVSVEQQAIKEPAFQVQGAQKNLLAISVEDYKELVGGKHIKIRKESLDVALKILDKFVKEKVTPEEYLKMARELALKAEPYYE